MGIPVSARSAEDSTRERLPLRGWWHVFAGQMLVTLLMLPMLRLHPALTLAATGFNLLALANTVRSVQARTAAARRGRPASGRDLIAVAGCIAGTALWAVALAVWPR
ncbi:hypothetical protein EAH86_08410 [Pedococcus bigeumensis]|uniref:Uncharacterized protein n=1 Tax=Pedococcus bigeumensis TaxID=433644 RepID=A0A502CYB9_9MICO|nr:hypothetical protein EAH86_08410 [Pedococcus bigeumensis]